MRSLFTLAVVVLAAPDRPDLTPKSAAPLRDQIQGEWQVIEATHNGGQPYAGVGPGAVFIFKDNHMTLRLKPGSGNPELKYLTPVDETKSPATIEFSPGDSSKPINQNLGIVKIENDTLIICYRFGEPNIRPTQFATTSESRLVLWHMKRVKR